MMRKPAMVEAVEQLSDEERKTIHIKIDKRISITIKFETKNFLFCRKPRKLILEFDFNVGSIWLADPTTETLNENVRSCKNT